MRTSLTEACRLYKAGVPTETIRAQLGCSASSLYYALRKGGVDLNRHRPHAPRGAGMVRVHDIKDALSLSDWSEDYLYDHLAYGYMVEWEDPTFEGACGVHA